MTTQDLRRACASTENARCLSAHSLYSLLKAWPKDCLISPRLLQRIAPAWWRAYARSLDVHAPLHRPVSDSSQIQRCMRAAHDVMRALQRLSSPVRRCSLPFLEACVQAQKPPQPAPCINSLVTRLADQHRFLEWLWVVQWLRFCWVGLATAVPSGCLQQAGIPH